MEFNFDSLSSRRRWARAIFREMNEQEFGAAALALFRWQWKRNRAYRRLSPDMKAEDWRQIPAMPQHVFKEQTVFNHPLKEARFVFHTSGTTTGTPGKQRLRRDDLYREAALRGVGRAGFFSARIPLHFLTKPPEKAPHSSLSKMFAYWKEKNGGAGSMFWEQNGGIDWPKFWAILSQAQKPVGIAGTAFHFVQAIDSGGSPMRPLPSGSWILETGGFKGRSREVEKKALYREISRLFGVPDRNIWNEYGMTELSSQAYARGAAGIHRTPPWARVLIMDPRTDREAKVGKIGIVRWVDLANVDTVAAVQTQDLAIRLKGGVRLIGRAPQTEPRGCSLMAEAA
jgi:hypothetical protein